jgi:hypothetical protein
MLRDNHYVGSKATQITAHNYQFISPSEFGKLSANEIPSFRWPLIHQLMVNRWIGLEGLMSISSYDEKGMPVLLSMLLEKREIGKVTNYQIVSKSGYQVSDSKFQFASMSEILQY